MKRHNNSKRKEATCLTIKLNKWNSSYNFRYGKNYCIRKEDEYEGFFERFDLMLTGEIVESNDCKRLPIGYNVELTLEPNDKYENPDYSYDKIGIAERRKCINNFRISIDIPRKSFNGIANLLQSGELEKVSIIMTPLYYNWSYIQDITLYTYDPYEDE